MVDWLLIGGNSHGIVLSKKNRSRVESFGSIYVGEDYWHSDGKVYRVGRCKPTQAQSAQIGALITEKKPRSIDHA